LSQLLYRTTRCSIACSAAGRANYLEDLGAGLDPRVEIMWTGEEVCAREFSPGHLARVPGRCGASPSCGTTIRSTTGRG
jgi:hypothetical protein